MTKEGLSPAASRRGVILSGFRRADSNIRASSVNRRHNFDAMAEKSNLFLQMLDLRSGGDELITVSVRGREGDDLHPFSTNFITGIIRVTEGDSPYTTKIPLDVLKETYKKGDILSLIGQPDSWEIENTNDRLRRIFREISLVSAALAKSWGSPNDKNRVRLDQLKAKLSVDVLTLWEKERDQAEGMRLTVEWLDEGRKKVEVRLGTTNKGGELESGFSLFSLIHFHHQPALEQLLLVHK